MINENCNFLKQNPCKQEHNIGQLNCNYKKNPPRHLVIGGFPILGL